MKRAIDKQSDILKRIEQNIGVPSLAEKLSGELSSSDFNSLLTAVFALRAENAAPNEMLKLYAQNKYAKPAACNAAEYRKLEADMLFAAEQKEVQSIILSPASLFGCCSVLGAVSQNKIISSTRNLEILSDATNMLALYIAAGIKDGMFSHTETPIHLCTTHRHIRYQPSFGAGMLPHFGIFTMVSAGKNRSTYVFEIETVLFHLRFYRDYWLQKHGSLLSVSFNCRAGYKDSEGFFDRITEAVKVSFPDMEIAINKQENNTTYYKGLQATLNAQINGKIIEIGDIGFTDWTQKLLNNTSERFLISAMAIDRQMFCANLRRERT
jgi:hypothetical protein